MSKEQQIEEKRKDLIEMAEIAFPFLDVVKPEFYYAELKKKYT